MGAMIGPNIGLAKFGNLIIRKVADEADIGHVSKSTEETVAKIEEYNKDRSNLNPRGKKVIIGSMDVIKWYPNTKAEPSAKAIRNMVEESEIDFEGFDIDVVSQYLGEYLTEKEIRDEGMEEILYIKKVKPKKQSKKIKKKYVKNVTKKHVNNPKSKPMNKKNTVYSSKMKTDDVTPVSDDE